MGGGSRVPWEQLKDLKVFPLEKKGSGTLNPIEGETRLILCVPRGRNGAMGASHRKAGSKQRLKSAF